MYFVVTVGLPSGCNLSKLILFSISNADHKHDMKDAEETMKEKLSYSSVIYHLNKLTRQSSKIWKIWIEVLLHLTDFWKFLKSQTYIYLFFFFLQAFGNRKIYPHVVIKLNTITFIQNKYILCMLFKIWQSKKQKILMLNLWILFTNGMLY